MLDLLLRNLMIRGKSEPLDIAIQDGVVVAIAPHYQGEAKAEYDLRGALAMPPFSDPHVHLDAVLTAGHPRHNSSGTLLEGIQIWGDRKRSLTFEDVYQRASEAVKWSITQGTLNIRTHVDICDEDLVALKAILKLKEDLKDIVNIQLVAFPQEGILCYAGGKELMEEAIHLGVDCIGGIPHFEWTHEDGVEELEYVFKMASKYQRMVDIHCDETDDDQSRFLEHVAALTIRHSLAGKVVAGHTTAMHSYNNAYAFKLIRLVARAGLSIIANPLDNAILQGRFDTYPKRRGLTRVKELLAAGINVGIGHDSIMDPWYPLGRAQMLQAAFVLLHMCQMSGRDEQRAVLDMITFGNAQALGLKNYRLAVGNPADIIIFELSDEFDLLRLLPLPQLVIKNGRVVASSSAPLTKLHLGESTEVIDFKKDSSPAF